MQSAPIFVVGFSRGGTTILMNLLASHPAVCTVGELHQVFKGSSHRDSKWKIAAKALTRDLPVILASGEDYVSPRNLQPRRQASRRLKSLIRRALDLARLESRHEQLNLFKSPGVAYLPQEIASSCMLAKLLDGSVHLFELLSELYPQAAFVGLLRNGLAVCEGHVRRGRNARDVGRLYRLVAETMLQQAQRWPNYHLLKFEDLLAHPMQRLRALYRQLGLDPAEVGMVRLQERPMLDDFGQHRLRGRREWCVRWLSPQQLHAVLDDQIDQRQIRHLDEADRVAFLQEAGPTMARLGYDPWNHGQPPRARAA